jgi:hypothetical protein
MAASTLEQEVSSKQTSSTYFAFMANSTGDAAFGTELCKLLEQPNNLMGSLGEFGQRFNASTILRGTGQVNPD